MDDRYTRLGTRVCKVLTEENRPVAVSELMGKLHLTYPEMLECLMVVNSAVQLEFQKSQNLLVAVNLKSNPSTTAPRAHGSI